jgi:Flp pilus assembly protein TadG
VHIMAPLTIPRGRCDGGQAVIEMALTLPLLLAVVFGIFDFGFMFQRYEVVTNAAREGARLGVLADYTEAQAEQRALNYLTTSGVRGTIRPCGGAEVPDTRCADLTYGTATVPGDPPRTVNQVTMVVEYDHEHVFVGPIMQLFGGSFSTVRLRAVSTMRRE